MEGPKSQEEWYAFAGDDLNTIDDAGVLPKAIAVRFGQALGGNFNGEWHSFKARGRGISSLYLDLGTPYIALEMRKPDLARQTYEELLALEEQLKAVVEISYRTFDNSNGGKNAAITLKLHKLPDES